MHGLISLTADIQLAVLQKTPALVRRGSYPTTIKIAQCRIFTKIQIKIVSVKTPISSIQIHELSIICNIDKRYIYPRII